ncbi:MAG: PLP-dependent aminotransferase family protein, partial [Lachnospiraceae bacterium]|nr:PLP-dependent aminotransferase family protein [Lachnospiraceae bacterium]
TYIRDEIKKGSLPCGMKLPSSRGLAQYLLVSRNTIDMAYGQLLSEGYIESKPKQGYYVSEIEDLMDITFPQKDPEKIVSGTEVEWIIDFSPNGVDMEYFPYNRWRKLMKEALMDDNRELFQTGDPMGDFELRKTIRQYLHQSRGVSCQEEQILVGAGLDYLLLLLCQVLGPQRTVAMEEATYKQAYRIFLQMNYQIRPIPMDNMGISLDDLFKSDAQLVYVMPSHQFPTGTVMPVSRRNKLLSWAMLKEERYIIEDDYDSEFRYQGKPIPSLQAADPMGKVIYAGTFSKAIAPAIRVGYLVLPWKLLKEFKKRVGFFACSVSRIDQTVLEHFIKEGFFERHLNKMRGIYRSKHEYLLRELKRMPKKIQVSGESAGLHVTLTLPEGCKEKEAVELAAEQGVKVYPFYDYFIGQEQKENRIILGFARLSEDEIRDGVTLLLKAWEPLLKTKQKEIKNGQD